VCVVSLLPYVADCRMLYSVCKVERFVLIILKEGYYYVPLTSGTVIWYLPVCGDALRLTGLVMAGSELTAWRPG